VSRKVICELSQIVKLINTRFDKDRERREKKERKKKILEAHRNSKNNTTNTIKKISMRQIQ
jgi:hypothetical protein